MKKSFVVKFAKENKVESSEPWEWDGVVVEGAHDAEFGATDDDDDYFAPSIGFMSMASSVTSPALTAATGSGSPGASEFDPLANAGRLHRTSSLDKEAMSEADLLDIGGDPDFLDSVDVDEEEGEGLREEMDDSDFFDWDGTVDEDAHFD